MGVERRMERLGKVARGVGSLRIIGRGERLVKGTDLRSLLGLIMMGRGDTGTDLEIMTGKAAARIGTVGSLLLIIGRRRRARASLGKRRTDIGVETPAVKT